MTRRAAAGRAVQVAFVVAAVGSWPPRSATAFRLLASLAAAAMVAGGALAGILYLNSAIQPPVAHGTAQPGEGGDRHPLPHWPVGPAGRRHWRATRLPGAGRTRADVRR